MKFSTVRFFGFAATYLISSWIFLESASSVPRVKNQFTSFTPSGSTNSRS